MTITNIVTISPKRDLAGLNSIGIVVDGVAA
jgi:hypothetical protein